MDEYVKQEAQNEGIDEKESIPENESINGSGYSGSTHDEVRRLDPEALQKHEQRIQRRLIVYRCKGVVLDLFEETREQARRNVYTPAFEVMDHAVL